MGSELADKPEINRIKNIINLNIMKCIKYKWYYVCVSVCGRGVPKCCGVHVEVSGNWRSGFSPSTLWILGLRLNSSHVEASAIITGTNSGSQRFVLM